MADEKKKKKSKKVLGTVAGVAAAVAAGTAAWFAFLKPASASEGPIGPSDDDDPIGPTGPTGPSPGPGPSPGGGGGGGSGPKFPRASGSPPPGTCGNGTYDVAYWDSETPPENRAFVVEHFDVLGYNFSGATKGDGTFQTSNEVKKFQQDYNLVSLTGDWGSIGGLAMDGKVGPCTLSALQYLVELAPQTLYDRTLFRTVAEHQRDQRGLPAGR